MKSATRTINVKTASAEYPVYVGRGLFAQLPRRIRLEKTRRLFVVTSPEIWSLWGEQFLSALASFASPAILFLPAGERYKRLAQVERLAGELASAGADRASC